MTIATLHLPPLCCTPRQLSKLQSHHTNYGVWPKWLGHSCLKCEVVNFGRKVHDPHHRKPKAANKKIECKKLGRHKIICEVHSYINECTTSSKGMRTLNQKKGLKRNFINFVCVMSIANSKGHTHESQSNLNCNIIYML